VLQRAAVRAVDVSGQVAHAVLGSRHTGHCAASITDDGAGQTAGRSGPTEQGTRRFSEGLLYRGYGDGLHATMFDLG
jgi:hypothetical protein